MAKITYVAPAPHPAHADFMGRRFHRGEAVDDHGFDDATIERLVGNPTFEVESSSPEVAPAESPARKGSPSKTRGV
jgi:hypothetical protein